MTLIGQTKETKAADLLFENLSFSDAAIAYKRLATKKTTEHVLKRLGDSYYKNVKMQEASEAYTELFETFIPKESEYMFKYAQTLRAIGNFEASDNWMKKFHLVNKNDSRGINFTSSAEDLAKIKDNKQYYEVTNLRSINTVNSDFGVTDYGNTILFSSPKNRSVFVKISHTRNEKHFLDIFKVVKEKISTKEGVNSDVRPMFSDAINSKFHESSVTFSKDNKIMYLTRNNYIDGKYRIDKKGYNNLKILRATWNLDEWDNLEELPFNSNEYSVGHPSISKDGKRLYFASDMPGGIGETDIYYVTINDDGSFGPPQNLGPKINTEGREMFPFISNDDILYFSSDGHFGIGALDIFESKLENGDFQKPENLKAPVNSNLDDFAFSINPVTKEGYLSSNREGGIGDDDIYAVLQLKKPCFNDIAITVIDKNTKLPLAESRIILKDNDDNLVKDTYTDTQGNYKFNLPCDKNYVIIATKDTFTPDQKLFLSIGKEPVVLELVKVVKEEEKEVFVLNENKDLIININPIYFNFDKSNIRPDAKVELDHIVSVMNQYPNLIISSNSHTDARGNDLYNEKLSDRRAKSTVKYIVSKGIRANRITGKGYGETRLTNGCIDNNGVKIKCTKAQHQANRRTEFVIIKK